MRGGDQAEPGEHRALRRGHVPQGDGGDEETGRNSDGIYELSLHTPALVQISHYYLCKQEELRCISIVEDSLAEAAANHERKCKEQIEIEKKVGLMRSCVETKCMQYILGSICLLAKS